MPNCINCGKRETSMLCLCGECSKVVKDIAPARLAEICQAEREGRCVVLPVPIGAPVWSSVFVEYHKKTDGTYWQEPEEWAFNTDMIIEWGREWHDTRADALAAIAAAEAEIIEEDGHEAD